MARPRKAALGLSCLAGAAFSQGHVQISCQAQRFVLMGIGTRDRRALWEGKLCDLRIALQQCRGVRRCEDEQCEVSVLAPAQSATASAAVSKP